MSSMKELLEGIKGLTFSPKLVEVSDEKIVLCTGDYDVEDVVSEATTVAGGAKPWVFHGMAKENGGGGYITHALIQAETTGIASQFVLFLFKDVPTCALGDDVTNTAPILADRRIYVGRIDLLASDDIGTGMSETEATPSTYGRLPKAFVCNPDSTALYGVLVIKNALDLADNTILRIKLIAEQY